ncbi:MAG: hypothetical protein GY827_11080 [Cytophagales bacterium]|nr:hypothetical protein [Cytophagales bacterium]
MKKSLIILTLISLFYLSSCQTEKDAVDFYYDQTSCSDPWQSSQDNSELERSVTKYLRGQGIKVFKSKIDHSNDLEIICLACDCITGTKIIVSVDEDKTTKMEELGFLKY